MQEFITRCEKLLKKEVKKYLDNRRKKINEWNQNNKEKLKQSQKKYQQTDKGKYACIKRRYKRRHHFKEACEDLSWEERILIGRFYKNCPYGYEVDHIIPISKGGKHRLSNLQYLTLWDNRKKSNKINWKK